jgi:hypothetical protein
MKGKNKRRRKERIDRNIINPHSFGGDTTVYSITATWNTGEIGS